MGLPDLNLDMTTRPLCARLEQDLSGFNRDATRLTEYRDFVR